MQKVKKYIWIILYTLSAIFVIYYIYKYLYILKDIFVSPTNISYFVLSIIINSIAFLVMASNWAFMVKRHHKGNYLQLLNIFYISQLTRYVPGNIWSFLVRYKENTKIGVNKSSTTYLLAIENIMLISIAFLFSVFAIGLIQINFTIEIIIFSICVISLLILFFNPKYLKKAVEIMGKRFKTEISFNELNKKDLFIVFLLFCLYWLLFGISFYFVTLIFIGNKIPLLTAIGINSLAWVIGYASLLTPSGLGIRESAFVVMLIKYTSSVSALGIAIVSRFIFTFSEVLGFIVVFITKKVLDDNKNNRLNRFIREYGFLSIIIVIYASFFSAYSSLKYKYFYDGIFDIGNMLQTLWNTLHGNLFMVNDAVGTGQLVSRFSDHADLLLIFLIPIYAIFNSAYALLVLQSIVVALGAIPVFLFTKKLTSSKFYPIFFSTLYLLLPSVENPNLFEFHAVVLGTTFILFSFYFLYSKKYTYASIFIFLSLLTKEEVGFTLSFMCLYFLLKSWFPKTTFGEFSNNKIEYWNKLKNIFKEKRKELLFLLFASILTFSYSILIILVFIPHFRGSSSLYLNNYSGSSFGLAGILVTTIIHPTSLIQSQGYYIWSYSETLLLPLSGLSFFSPFILLISFPEWIIDVLSNNHNMQSVFFQYPAVLNPFIILSSISGFFNVNKFLKTKFSWYRSLFLILIVVSSLIYFMYKTGPLYPAEHSITFDDLKNNLSARDFKELDLLEDTIPKSASISAENNYGSKFSSRQDIYLFPANENTVDYLILKKEYDIPNHHNIYSGDQVFIYKKN